MTIARTERPSYRSKKNYAKFGRLQANKDLNMHELNRPKNKYLHKKISSEMADLEVEKKEEIKSNSLIRISEMKKNIKKKKEIKEKMAVDDLERDPIKLKKSKKVIDSKKGGKFEYERKKTLKPTEINEVKELLRPENEIGGSN